MRKWYQLAAIEYGLIAAGIAAAIIGLCQVWQKHPLF